MFLVINNAIYNRYNIYYNKIQSPFALLNYYHINSVWGRIAKRKGGWFWGAASLKANKWKRRERCNIWSLLWDESETRCKRQHTWNNMSWSEILPGRVIWAYEHELQISAMQQGEKRKGIAITRQKWWWLYLQQLWVCTWYDVCGALFSAQQWVCI